MKKLIYPTYSNNEEEKNKFLALWETINSTYKGIGSKWGGDYLISTYEKDNQLVELWYDAELGLAEKIIYL